MSDAKRTYTCHVCDGEWTKGFMMPTTSGRDICRLCFEREAKRQRERGRKKKGVKNDDGR